jgi:D123
MTFKDASWILAPSSPLKCTSPADVYLFLKSSDFVAHDLNPDMVFEGCSLEDGRPHDAEPTGRPKYQVELVLKKWFAIDKSRELRCFVRDDTLIGALSIAFASKVHRNSFVRPIPPDSGITQRDPSYYEFLNEPKTQESIRKAVLDFWKHKIRNTWLGGQSCRYHSPEFSAKPRGPASQISCLPQIHLIFFSRAIFNEQTSSISTPTHPAPIPYSSRTKSYATSTHQLWPYNPPM